MTLVGNPLLDAALGAPCRCPIEFHFGRAPQFGCSLCAPGGVGSPEWTARIMLRESVTRRYAWAIPSPEALDAIAARGPIVEIGAGTGYWAALLARHPGKRRAVALTDDLVVGTDVVAYDEKPGFNTWCAQEPWFPIRVGGPEALAAHADRTLFVCWPPMSGMAAESLGHYAGRAVIYVGEGPGGCTADDAFFDALDRDWTEVATIDIPQWYGIRDYLAIYERKDGRDGLGATRESSEA